MPDGIDGLQKLSRKLFADDRDRRCTDPIASVECPASHDRYSHRVEDRLIDADSWLEPCGHRIVETAARAGGARPQRHVKIGGWNSPEFARHDADRSVGTISKRDRRSHGVRVRTKETRPKTMAQNNGVDTANTIVDVAESVAIEWTSAEHRKKLFRHRHSFHKFGRFTRSRG